MATNAFIPKVWSETLYQELEKELVAVRNCNREFEGDIKKVGDTVNICGLGDIEVFDYTKNSDMGDPQVLDSTNTMLRINKCKAFNFLIDDIDAAQQAPAVMQHAMHRAAIALAEAADQEVFSLHDNINSSSVMTGDINETNIFEFLINVRTRMMKNNVGASDELILEVSPEIAAVILKAKLDMEPAEVLEKGYIGRVLGFRVYVSNHVMKEDADGLLCHKCYVRTRRAVAFAQQVQEMEAYRPELRFADAIKGMILFGAKIVYPKEFLLLDLAIVPVTSASATA